MCEDVVAVDDIHAERVGRVKIRAFAKRLLDATALHAVPRVEPCLACLGTGWIDSQRAAENPALRQDCESCGGTGQQQRLDR